MSSIAGIAGHAAGMAALVGLGAAWGYGVDAIDEAVGPPNDAAGIRGLGAVALGVPAGLGVLAMFPASGGGVLPRLWGGAAIAAAAVGGMVIESGS